MAFQLDREWEKACKWEVENGSNKVVIFRPDKGLLVHFGKTFYVFDKSTDEFQLAHSGDVILNGRIKKDFDSKRNRLIHTQIFEKSDGTEISIEVTCTDKGSELFDLGLRMGRYTFSAEYDLKNRSLVNSHIQGSPPGELSEKPWRLLAFAGKLGQREMERLSGLPKCNDLDSERKRDKCKQCASEAAIASGFAIACVFGCAPCCAVSLAASAASLSCSMTLAAM